MMRTRSAAINISLFVGLNITDVLLTIASLSLGARELNPVYSAASPLGIAAIRTVILGIVILALVLSRRIHLINWLNIGLILVVIWNIVAVISWSA
jgi:hypothetical protein